MEVVLAPEHASEFVSRSTPLHLRVHDLRCVCALTSCDGEGLASAEYAGAIDDAINELGTEDLSLVIKLA